MVNVCDDAKIADIFHFSKIQLFINGKDTKKVGMPDSELIFLSARAKTDFP